MKRIHVAHLLGGGIVCGASQYALELMQGLERDSFRVSFVILKDGPLSAELERRRVPVHVLGKRRTGDPLALSRVVRVLREKGVDLVHTHTSNSNLYGILGSFFVPACRAVATLHAYYAEVNAEAIPLRILLKPGYRVDRFLLGRTAGIISVSRSIRDRIAADGLDPERITVIPNGIDVEACRARSDRAAVREELGVGPGEVLVGTAGRLAAVKNQALLLEAAAAVVSDVPGLRLAIFGDGPREESLKGLAARMGIAARVLFPGWKEDLPRYLSGLDLFALPSRSEVAPFVLLQSMALGIPVVATRVGGVPEMVLDGETGLLTEEGNAQEMAAAVRLLARDPERRRAFGSRGERLVRSRFSRASMLEATAAFYRRAFSSHGGTT
ncbi:MAG: glycosyltransferase [bacterium]